MLLLLFKLLVSGLRAAATRRRRWWRTGCRLGLLLPLAGCGTLSYYAQALEGHADLLRRRVPVAELLHNPGTPAALKERLELAQQLRAFASRALALPDNASYTAYSDLERPQALWNVFAAPEFALTPHTWCLPIAGCVAYHGWFREADARAEAAQLAAAGLDVQVAPVPAYSTLGWSDDPLTNVMLDLEEAALAALLFHELAHQRVYVPGDSAFNEGYATAVAAAGVARWLQAQPEKWHAWQQAEARKQQRLAWLLAARQDLETLYAQVQAQALPPEALRAAKRARLCALQAQLDAQAAGAAAPATPAQAEAAEKVPENADCVPRHNNASLAAVGVYHQLVPAFTALLARHGGDFAAFHAAVAELAALPPAERRAALTAAAAP